MCKQKSDLVDVPSSSATCVATNKCPPRKWRPKFTNRSRYSPEKPRCDQSSSNLQLASAYLMHDNNHSSQYFQSTSWLLIKDSLAIQLSRLMSLSSNNLLMLHRCALCTECKMHVQKVSHDLMVIRRASAAEQVDSMCNS